LIDPGVAEYHPFMSKTEILDELPKLTKTERDEIRLKLAEIDGDSWFDNGEPLSEDEKALLDSRLAAYLKNPEEGSSWEEVESRIRARLTR
jgi:putative addiction module component (TIGR02574 family)